MYALASLPEPIAHFRLALSTLSYRISYVSVRAADQVDADQNSTPTPAPMAIRARLGPYLTTLPMRIDTNGDLKMWVHKYIKSRKAHCTNTFLTHKRAWLPNSPHGSLPAPFANTNTYKHVRCTNECPSCPAARARLEKPEIDCRHAMVHERAQKRAHAKASLCLSRWPVLSAM